MDRPERTRAVPCAAPPHAWPPPASTCAPIHGLDRPSSVHSGGRIGQVMSRRRPEPPNGASAVRPPVRLGPGPAASAIGGTWLLPRGLFGGRCRGGVGSVVGSSAPSPPTPSAGPGQLKLCRACGARACACVWYFYVCVAPSLEIKVTCRQSAPTWAQVLPKAPWPETRRSTSLKAGRSTGRGFRANISAPHTDQAELGPDSVGIAPCVPNRLRVTMGNPCQSRNRALFSDAWCQLARRSRIDRQWPRRSSRTAASSGPRRSSLRRGRPGRRAPYPHTALVAPPCAAWRTAPGWRAAPWASRSSPPGRSALAPGWQRRGEDRAAAHDGVEERARRIGTCGGGRSAVGVPLGVRGVGSAPATFAIEKLGVACGQPDILIWGAVRIFGGLGWRGI